MDPRAEDFIKKVDQNIGGISVSLVKSTEFQQSLLATFDALIRARSEKRRNIIKTVYIKGYIPSDKKSIFEMERFYLITQNISFDAIDYLRFMHREILPRKVKNVKKKVSEMSKNKEGTDEWWINHIMRMELDSVYVMEWIHEKFNINSAKVRAKYRLKDGEELDSERMFKQSEKERAQQNLFAEVAAELQSLGIFRTMPTYDYTGYILTDFGNSYMKYLSEH